jgi:hypothetical protein
MTDVKLQRRKRKARYQAKSPNVTWHKTRKRWIGRFYRDGRMYHVGYWKREELQAAIDATEQAVAIYEGRIA